MKYTQVIIDTEKHLGPTPETALEIWRRMGQWAPNSVRCALRELHSSGRAERIEEAEPGRWSRLRYYRVNPASCAKSA